MKATSVDQEAPGPLTVPATPAAVPRAEVTNGGDPGEGNWRRAEVIRRRDTTYRRLLAVADMWAAALSLLTSAVLLGDDRLTVATLAVPPLFVLVAKALGLYDRDEHLLHKTTLDEVPALFGIATLAALLLWLSNGLLIEGELGRRQILGTWALLFLFMVCFRSIARMIGTRFTETERCLLVGSAATAEELRSKLAVSRAVNAELVGFLPPAAANGAGDADNSGLIPQLGSILASRRIDVDRVILATDPGGADELLYIIRELKSDGVKVSVLPEASRVAGSSVELDHLHGITLLGMRKFHFSRSSMLVKRFFDVIGSAIALTLMSPLLLAIAIAVRLSSPGPVLFRQRRVGVHGEQFELLKFRSMVDQADDRKDEFRHLNEGAAGLFKIHSDPRVTRVGRYLRRWQLDELPQLINVFRGEMSLVGPRPLIPEEDSKIEGWYRRRLDVPPGITGHWQVLGSSSLIPLDEMVKLDYLYVANWSLWGDVKVLMRTVPFLVRRGGI
jgi:exopolysaccharide biosynthesis polyprenyl glycosylphosphotransferase